MELLETLYLDTLTLYYYKDLHTEFNKAIVYLNSKSIKATSSTLNTLKTCIIFKISDDILKENNIDDIMKTASKENQFVDELCRRISIKFKSRNSALNHLRHNLSLKNYHIYINKANVYYNTKINEDAFLLLILNKNTFNIIPKTMYDAWFGAAKNYVDPIINTLSSCKNSSSIIKAMKEFSKEELQVAHVLLAISTFIVEQTIINLHLDLMLKNIIDGCVNYEVVRVNTLLQMLIAKIDFLKAKDSIDKIHVVKSNKISAARLIKLVNDCKK